MVDHNLTNRVFVHHPSVVARAIAGEVILVPIRSNVADIDSIYTMNEVATRIWQLLDGHRSVAEIRETIVAEFDVSADEAGNDVDSFLLELSSINAVREA